MKKLILLFLLISLFSFVEAKRKNYPSFSCCSSNCNCSCSSGRCSSNCCSSNCCSSNCCSSNCCRLSTQKKDENVDAKKDVDIRESIREAYGKVAEEEGSCCGQGLSCCVGGCCGGGVDLSKYLGYTEEELDAIPEANLGLGCGHPVSLGELKKGYTVLDLGSGAGIDCFIAAKKVGPEGKVIGVDMTPAMLKKARTNAEQYGFENVEFRFGYIEDLPVSKSSIDVIISNCVINLSTDKFKVFQEAYRVLKPGGKMFVSDVVLLGELTPEQKKDTNLICACIGGALLKEDYTAKLEKAGFEIEIIDEDKEICKTWFGHNKLPISSLKFVAHKPTS